MRARLGHKDMPCGRTRPLARRLHPLGEDRCPVVFRRPLKAGDALADRAWRKACPGHPGPVMRARRPGPKLGIEDAAFPAQ